MGTQPVSETDPRLATSVLRSITDLKPHPQNYRTHPEDQIRHIMQSITEHGLYRNVVVARDNTILAGHGVVTAALRLGGITQIPVVRLDIDPDSATALKVLAGDNEIGRLADNDDRRLTELLRSVRDELGDLSGTGFDDAMLANLVYVTRDADEIATPDHAAEWVGMPDYDTSSSMPLKVIVNVESEDDRAKLLDVLGNPPIVRGGDAIAASVWWPARDREDRAAVQWTQSTDDTDDE